jgi:NAD(P)-dependent dehydrogenase (short-subunit alcohol dehydrogenase family)
MSTGPDLSGRTALVTGSATRVGRELLLRIAAHGADVAVHYRTSEAAATATAERLRERYDCPLDADTRLDFDPYGV